MRPSFACSTQLCHDLALMQPAVIRGNASEVMALATSLLGPNAQDGSAAPGGTSDGGGGRGVDSTASSLQAVGVAKALAARLGCIVAVSGATDVVTDGRSVYKVHNGVPLLQQITGSGCAVTALIAAFLVGADDVAPVGGGVAASALLPCGLSARGAMSATAAAFAYFGACAEIAAQKFQASRAATSDTAGTDATVRATWQFIGPASLRVALVDALYHLGEVTMSGELEPSPGSATGTAITLSEWIRIETESTDA
jgi:hydroxyethylthiazole kinase-like sugar kinase family protein